MRLVISDAHEGLKHAIGTVLNGAAWQRCRVHFMRNLLATVPQARREPIAAERRYFSAESMKRLLTPTTAVGEQELLMAIA